MELPAFLVVLTGVFGLLLSVDAKAQYNGYNPNQNYIQHSSRYHGQARYDDGRGYNYDAQPGVYSTYSQGYYNQPSAAYGYDTNSGYHNSGYSTPQGQYGYSNNNNYGNSYGYNTNNNNNDYNNRYGYSSSSYNNRPWDNNNRGGGGYSTGVYTTPYYDRSSNYYNDRYNAAPGPIVRVKAIPQAVWSLSSMIKVGAIALAVIMGQIALAGFFM